MGLGETHLYYLWMEGGKQYDIVLASSVTSLPQVCGKLDPTFASATLLFQKDPPANVQLFQVSTHGMFNIRAPAATCDDSWLSFGK